MKLGLIFTFTFALTCFISVPDSKNLYSDTHSLKQSINVCPAENNLARENLELFISHPDWSNNRIDTGTNGLSVSQIQLLTDSQHSSVCQNFNSEFDDTINETWSKGGSKYDLVYYKVGSFYFVSIVVAQPSDPEYVSVGLSFLIIYDSNLNRIEGFSF
ncbi:MAG: hypothetical protein GVY08_08490 [Bacteroidetes bacterium]|jgi:hypothetical protein|nr:hypothetical protein [Bacteroidota bacterium]